MMEILLFQIWTIFSVYQEMLKVNEYTVREITVVFIFISSGSKPFSTQNGSNSLELAILSAKGLTYMSRYFS